MTLKKAFEIPELLTLDGRPVNNDNDDDEQVWGSCSLGCSDGGPQPKPTQPAPQG